MQLQNLDLTQTCCKEQEFLCIFILIENSTCVLEILSFIHCDLDRKQPLW